MFRIKGATTHGTMENVSYILIVISAVLVAVGIGLGSFIRGTVYIAVGGAALFLPAIILFIASRLLETPKSEESKVA